jgi:hypothetical protein
MVLRHGHLQPHAEERECRKGLDERRMLGVDPEVTMLPSHVAGVNVVALVKSDGIAAGGTCELQEKEQK